MRIQKKQIFFGVCLFLMFAVSYGYAYWTDEAVLQGRLRTGKVEIELNTKELRQKNTRPVMAGQTIRYQPQIRAKGSACYVRLTVDIRVKKTFPDASPALPHLKQNRDWVRKGDCFYYTKPLKRGQVVSPFSEIQVPEAWDERISGFSVHLTADALQMDSFTPAFNSYTPWGSVEIQQDKKESCREYRTVRKTEPNSVIYRGNSSFEVSAGDLFKAFPFLSPGDKVSSFVELKNETSEPVQIELKRKVSESELCEKIGLSLFLGNSLFYQGSLASSHLNEFHPLTTLEAGEKKSLQYVLSLPAGLDNSYSLKTSSVVWHLRAVESEVPKSVQTEDPFPVYLVVLVILLSGSVLFFSWRSKKGEEK